MKRNAINFIGRIIYSSKIKEFEKKIEEIYELDWKNKSWEDYAKDCFKLQSENQELILNSSGSKRMQYIFGLQALYNIRAKELDFMKAKIETIPAAELKYFFDSEYEILKADMLNKDLGDVMELYIEFGRIAGSPQVRKKLKWRYVSSVLAISAIEDLFGHQLNNIENNLRNI